MVTAGAVIPPNALFVLSLAFLAILTVLSTLAVLTILTVVAVLTIVAIVPVLTIVAVVPVLTIVAVTATDCKTDTVILGTTLSDGHDHRLMIGSSKHGAETIVASRQTTGNICGEKALAVPSIIDTLEESKLACIQRRSRAERTAEVLYSDMRMANDVTRAIQVLRGGIVRAIRISEGTGVEISDLDLNLKVRVCLDVVVILWVDQNAGNHLGLGGDITHHNTVARPLFLLETVCQFLARAEIDEVGGIRFRSRLAFSCVRGAI